MFISAVYQPLERVPTTRVRERQALRSGLDVRVKNEAARVLHENGINPAGRDLDRQRLGRDNLIVMKAAIDRRVNATVGRRSGQRQDFSRAELDQIDQNFAAIVEAATSEVLNGA